MGSWLELIGYVSYLLMAVMFGLFIPFFASEMYQQFKAKKLAEKIADNQDYEKYDIDLLEVLLRDKRIETKYLKLLIRHILGHIHENSDNNEKLNYFKKVYADYNSDEIYNDISQPISVQVKALKKVLDESQQTVLSNLAYNIKILEAKSQFSKKLNMALTIISILVTIIGIAYPFFSK